MKRFPRLNLKNINRLFMLAVVFAPIFYLFGSLFTALNGANGVQLFSQEEEETSVDMSVSYNGNTYQRYSYFPYSAWFDSNFSNPTERLNDTAIYLYKNSITTAIYQQFNWDFETSIPYYVDYDNECFGLREGADFYWENGDQPWYLSFYTGDFEKTICWEVFLNQNSGDCSFHYIYYTYDDDYLEESWESSVFFEYNQFEFGTVLEHSEFVSHGIDRVDSLRIAPRVAPTITTPSVSEEISYSDYVFGQFFAKDNFLVQMGKDSLSADPNGFAPANSLVQLLDGSVFHFGAENQIACMAYGYAVWVFNAVVLDMVIVLSLKLLLLPLRAVEIFEKGEKE